MYYLDIILLIWGLIAGLASYSSWKDSLYKLFLWLIIGFLLYALVETQVALSYKTAISEKNSYQIYLWLHSTGILSTLLFSVPILWIFFMLHPRFSIKSYRKSPSHILLWLLLPIFLIGILAFLWDGSLLQENSTWKRVFSFFEQSFIYRIFMALPWAIFALLWFLIFYKTLFILLVALLKWIYNEVILQFFRSWKEKRVHENDEEEIGEEGNEGNHH